MFKMLEGIRMIVLLVSLFFCAWIDWKTERVRCAATSAGRNGSRIIAFVCTGRIRFYLMTGMSVGIALLLYSLVTHESIGYGDGCLFCDDRFISWNLGEPCAAFAGICFSGNRLGSVAF